MTLPVPESSGPSGQPDPGKTMSEVERRRRIALLLAWGDALFRKAVRIRHGHRVAWRDRLDTYPREFTAAEAARVEEILKRRSERG